MIARGALLAGGTALLVALAISLILTPIVRRWALKRAFIDAPGGAGSHKTHRDPVPFGGGIAITAAVVLPAAVVLLMVMVVGEDAARPPGRLDTWFPAWAAWIGGVRLKALEGLAILAGAVVLHIVGLLDDHRPMSAWPKLALQVMVALVLTAGFGIRSLEFLGAPAAIVITTLWIVGLTNAFNFLDNMDGLSGGVAALTAIALAVAAFLAGQVFVPCLLLLVAGAVIGFLCYNFPPATVFMGDGGSLVVGYLLAVLTVLTTFYDPEQGHKPFGVLMPLLVFAVPLYDMGSVCWHRYRAGRSIFSSDRGHFSHRLVRLGMRPISAVLTIYLATAATALPALLLPALDWGQAMIIFGQCVCVVAIIAILESRHDP